jgi:hypothetical protein
MDLSYGPHYEAFREEVRRFLGRHGKDAPRGKACVRRRCWLGNDC